jgi:AraC-like DNA-binding protein
MAYERRILYASELLAWEQVTLQATAPAWSDEYRVASPRLLLPVAHSFECRVGRSSWTCDARTVLRLSPCTPYRLRQRWRAQRSLLLILRDPDAGGPSARHEVEPSALARLAVLQSRWRRGLADSLELDEGLLAFANSTRRDALHGAGKPHPAVERAREFLADRFAQPDALAQIAQAAHCSPYHLARVFRARTGSTIHAYRTHLRMVHALYRLQEGEQSLSLLAAELGYSSHAHFTAVFTALYGHGPAQMRRNLVARAVPR